MQECGRELPGKCPAYCSALQASKVTGHWPGQASLYPVNSESIWLSINGIYVANVGGAEPLKPSMGVESVGPSGGHWPCCVHDLFYLYSALWHVAIALTSEAIEQRTG